MTYSAEYMVDQKIVGTEEKLVDITVSKMPF